MFLGESSKEDTLFERASLFDDCHDYVKKKIIFACACNDIRFIKTKNQQQAELLDYLKIWTLNDHCPNQYIFEAIEKVLQVDFKSLKGSLEIEKSNWLPTLSIALSTNQCQTADLWTQSVVRNLILFSNGFCPLLNFAFGAWLWEDFSQQRIVDLIELSTTYLYRLAPLQSNPQYKSGKIYGEGAYCFVVEHKSSPNSSNIVCKAPKNLAAELFVNQQEARVLQYLSLTPLSPYIPKFLKYDQHTGALFRTYLEGVSGHKLLATPFFSEQVESIENLKKIYHLFRDQANLLEICFDIHPSNFIWSENLKSWFLIDLGPMPKIGSDYFPFDSFELYFKKIWMERYERMEKEPIRSVDLGF